MHEPEINKMKGPPAVTFSLPERIMLHAASGDVLISPLTGSAGLSKKAERPKFEPYVDFEAIQNPRCYRWVTILKNVGIDPAGMGSDESSRDFALYL